MQGLERFSNAVGTLYAAAADPERWPAALRAIEELTGSVGAVLNFIPVAGDPPITLAGRFNEEQCHTYSTVYHGMCRRIAYGSAHPEAAAHYDALIATEWEMDRDPVYDWLATNGLRYYIAGHVHRNARYLVYASLQRSPAQGHVQRPDINLFNMVRRHLGQALALADELGTLHQHRGFSVAALDASPQALFALTERGRVLFANRAADRLLHEKTALAMHEGRINACLPSERAALARLIASACHPLEDGGGGGWLRLRRTSGAMPLALFATALPPVEALLPLESAQVLLAVHDPLSRASVASDALRAVFGLTDAECRIAEGLAAGMTLHQLAVLGGTSAETVKSQLKAVFSKLDAHRQQDVTRIVLGLAGTEPHPPNGG